MVSNPYAGQYTRKIYKNGNKAIFAQANSKVIEEMALQDLSTDVDGVSTVIPQVRLFIAPIITCAYDL